MKLSYELTLEDYKAALRLHRKQKLNTRIAHFIWIALLPILAVIAWASFLYNLDKEAISFPGSLSLPIGMSFCCAVAVLLQYLNVRKQFSNIFPPGRTDRNVSTSIDEDYLISAIPGVSEGKYFWNAILKFAQDENITLFYVADKKLLFIPTKAFSLAERTELDDLIARHCVKGKS
jgi:hypothetical protein